MTEMDDRYRTRFRNGLLVDIQPPDNETSMAILNNFKEKELIQVDEEVLRFIATNIRSSVRELEGAFKKVQYFSTLSHQKITLELAENALKDMIKPYSAREITVEYIIDIVTDHFQLSSDAIVSKKRQKTIAYPRQICMYLCKELTDLSTTEIGETEGIEFKVTGKQLLEPGWRVIFANPQTILPDGMTDPDTEPSDGDEERTLPTFVKGESGPHLPTLNEKWTQPPKPYTEATLLRAMETAGKLVDNDELRDAL